MEPMPMDEPGVEPLPDFPGKPAPESGAAPEPRSEPEPDSEPAPESAANHDRRTGPRATATVRKITVNLIAVGDEALEYLMDLRRMNMTDTVNRELQRGAYIERELAKGSKLLIERPDGKQRELGFL